MIATLLCLALAQESPATTVATNAIQPQVTVAPDDTIHVVFIRGGNIEVATSVDQGKTFGRPVIAIDGKGKAQGGKQRGPRIGVDAEGRIVVTCPIAFSDPEPGKRYPAAELWLARSADQGKTWSAPLQVNEVAKTAAESLHWMAVAPSGDAHVAWLDFREGKTNALWYARVTGDKAGKNLKLTGPVCECCAPGLAVDGKGNPTVVVRERKQSDRAILIMTSKDGGKTFSAPAPLNSAPTKVDS